MYEVTLSNCYMDEEWIFDDYETAAVFVKMAFIGGKEDLSIKIRKIKEEKQNESL